DRNVGQCSDSVGGVAIYPSSTFAPIVRCSPVSRRLSNRAGLFPVYARTAVRHGHPGFADRNAGADLQSDVGLPLSRRAAVAVRDGGGGGCAHGNCMAYAVGRWRRGIACTRLTTMSTIDLIEPATGERLASIEQA